MSIFSFYVCNYFSTLQYSNYLSLCFYLSMYVYFLFSFYVYASLSLSLSLSLSPTHPIYTHLGILPLGFPTCLLFTYTRPTTISPSSLALTIYISLCTYLSLCTYYLPLTYLQSFSRADAPIHTQMQTMFVPSVSSSFRVCGTKISHMCRCCCLLLAAVCSLQKGLANFICLSSHFKRN